MKNKIDVYIRNSADRPLLNFYVPENLREAFISGIKNGSIQDIGASINFEMPIGDHAGYDYDTPNHLRIDISNINVSYTDDIG